ncbi:MAG: beta-galactosidase [Bacteroidetes bacterium]|jgi:hypothetical protein|nr:beta-galactosidase [Bacteroidota bacterium]
MKKVHILVCLLPLPFLFFSYKKTSVPTVAIKKANGAFTLLRNGEPYFIKGAGGLEHYDRLKECGGNSVRLWSTEGAKQYLDKAHALGLTVTLGLDMGHERRGFNYDDKKAVKEQLEKLKKEVLLYKDHPALLMWGVGNEVDQFAKNYNVWYAVNDLAKFIHEVDPNHPTTTMLAGVPKKHIQEIIKRCPHLDILSINAFRWIEPVKRDITAAGWKGPYLLGEWGPTGYWESETVPWGTFIEETSTEKAKACEERYKHIKSNSERCLGGYIFFWGNKQARTHTLLSLFSEKGEGIEVQDMLQKEWTGKAPKNSAPKIVPIGIDDFQTHKGVYLTPSSNHKAYTDATDPDGDKLYFYWEIYQESKEKKEGGDTEAKPASLNDLIIDGKGRVLSFKAPQQEGAYRLFVEVYDGNKHMATANTPFYVKK